jgi:Concanavalin A-like lectin/glucanases superfamily
MYLYVNGALVATANTGADVPFSSSGLALYMGSNQYTTALLNGTMDDVRIYNRALSAAEISALAHAGTEGDLMYNNDYHLYQFCGGTNWQPMGPTGAGGATSYAPSGGLAGWWKFDEASGTVAADSSGNSNTGTASGTTVVAGKIGNARSFNGTSDNIAVGNPASLQIAGDITMCAWAYPQNASSFILSKSDGGGNYDYGLYITGAGSLSLYYGAGLTASTAIGLVSSNIWQHLCAVVQSNVATFYINGVPYTGGAATITNTNQQFYIGAHNGGGWALQGNIDELRVYNRALTATEITALYNYTGGSNCSPEGGMFYDSDHSIMQYCNGASWVRIGQ